MDAEFINDRLPGDLIGENLDVNSKMMSKLFLSAVDTWSQRPFMVSRQGEVNSRQSELTIQARKKPNAS